MGYCYMVKEAYKVAVQRPNDALFLCTLATGFQGVWQVGFKHNHSSDGWCHTPVMTEPLSSAIISMATMLARGSGNE